jgi:hypothetical protein
MFQKRIPSYPHKSVIHDLWQLIREQCEREEKLEFVGSLHLNDLQLNENLDRYTDDFWQIIQKECEIKSPNDIYKLKLFLSKDPDAYQKLFEKMFEKLWTIHINTVSPVDLINHFDHALYAIINHLPKRAHIKIYLDRLNIFNHLKGPLPLTNKPIDFLAYQTENWRPCENFLKQCIETCFQPTQAILKKFIKVPIVGKGGCGLITLNRLEELLRASTLDPLLQLEISMPFALDRKNFHLPLKISTQNKKVYNVEINTTITHFVQGTRSKLFNIAWAHGFNKFGALEHYFTKDEVALFSKKPLLSNKKFYSTMPVASFTHTQSKKRKDEVLIKKTQTPDCVLLKYLRPINKYLTMRATEMGADDYYKKRESFQKILKKMDDLLLNRETLCSQNKLQDALSDLKQFIKDEANKFKGVDRRIKYLKSTNRSRYYQHLKNLDGAITTLSDLIAMEDRIVAYHQIYDQMDHCHIAARKYHDHYTLFPFFKAEKKSNERLENHGSRERKLYAIHYQNLSDEDKEDFPTPNEEHMQEYDHATISPKIKLKFI